MASRPPSRRSPAYTYMFLLSSLLLALAPPRRSPVQAFSSPAAIPSSRAKSKRMHSYIKNNGTRRASSPGTDSTGVDTAPNGSPEKAAENRLTSGIFSHHVAVKTRNIENAIKFYSLLGFEVESKFVAGPARAAWLLHEGCSGEPNNNSQSRIELLEVPAYMLDEQEGKIKRAIDLTRREELLGLNHFALDVTGCIPRPDNDDGASEEGTACALYQLQEWMDDLNASSVEKFGKTLRVALAPTKRIIGKEVYEMAFLYDADGTLVELLNHSGTLEQDVGDGWLPWDGKGFVQ